MELTRQVVLETRTRVADGAGGYVDGWAALGQLWAAMEPGSGREKLGAGAVVLSGTPWRIYVRAAPVGHSARPRPDQRFREGARVFRITSVAEDGVEARFLQCRAIEEVLG